MRTLLGTGVLNWPSVERVCDRYGIVYLLDSDEKDSDLSIALKRLPEGRLGRLIAIPTQTRESYHIGDLMRGFYPETPALGEELVLGEGRLFYEQVDAVGIAVGLCPVDNRQIDWLHGPTLYKAHEQTVQLYFEPA